jgi:tetratricopeptide (TPR) repeat protein
MVDRVEQEFQQGNFQLAGKLAKELFRVNFLDIDGTTELNAEQVFQLAGLLVDIGARTREPETISFGLYIFDVLRDEYTKHYSLYSLEYNIANAKSSLYDVRSILDKSLYSLENLDSLVEAKNHYWRALIELSNKDTEFPELLVNLGNTLSKCARIPEALFYYEVAIRKNPEIAEAHLNRSECLEWLNRISGTYSNKLLWEELDGYEKAAHYELLTASKRRQVESRIERLNAHLFDNENDRREMECSLSQDEEEFNSLSEYRKWTLKEYLSLTEHGLYCWCSGAASDNLTIPLTSTAVGGAFVPKMELYLNRIKSEYCLARSLYSAGTGGSTPNDVDLDVRYSDLRNGEITGTSVEHIRTAFRLCFGILDKIANAVCDLFQVCTPRENLYFDSFWRSKEQRWEVLGKSQNPGLIALYAIATDLNQQSGELRLLKQWRNLLEHGMLVVVDGPDLDPYHSYETVKETCRVKLGVFQSTAIDLLRLTRAAIFSFVWTVRNEAFNLPELDGAARITIGPKTGELDDTGHTFGET